MAKVFGVTKDGIRNCPQCGGELNMVEGYDAAEYAWETAECLKCQLAILVRYTQVETVMYMSRRLQK